MNAHFVLDHGFPANIARQELQQFLPPGVRITRLYDLNPALTRDHEDWQLILKLDARGDVNGFITTDDRMTRSPHSMGAMNRSHLTLVVTDATGHHPVRATGLVLTHLTEIAKGLDATPRAFILRPRFDARAPQDHFDHIASQRGVLPSEQWLSVRDAVLAYERDLRRPSEQ